MKTIERKTKKQLWEEGITDELLLSINMNMDYSPVILNKGETPVNLLQCKGGFWITPEFGEFLKDESGTKIVVNAKYARIGRARYMLLHADDILNEQISRETGRIVKLVESKCSEILKKAEEILILADLIPPLDNFTSHLVKMIAPSTKIEMAKMYATPKLLQLRNKLKELYDNKDWDSLHSIFYSDGLPLVTTFDTTNDRDINALIAMFHKDNLLQTVNEINDFGRIRTMAKANVLKQK